MRLHRPGDGVEVRELVGLHPLAQLAHAVGDFLGRRDLVIVEAVQRVFPTVRVAFRGSSGVSSAYNLRTNRGRRPAASWPCWPHERSLRPSCGCGPLRTSGSA